MRIRVFHVLFLSLALSAFVSGQDPNPGQDQNSAPPPAQNGGGYQRPGGRGFGGGGMMGRGISGTVTEAAADHFSVKTFAGQSYTVDFSDNTRFVKLQGGMGGRRGMGGGGGMGRRGMGGNPPQQIKASEIKVGDAIMARGEVNTSTKTVGAVAVMELDPQMAQRMQQMTAEYGKTWLMGRVTNISGTKVTLIGSQDSAEHSFVVNENTDFRERRNPITLADVKTGDMVRVQGALSDGIFTASVVNLMRTPGGSPNGPAGSPN